MRRAATSIAYLSLLLLFGCGELQGPKGDPGPAGPQGEAGRVMLTVPAIAHAKDEVMSYGPRHRPR